MTTDQPSSLAVKLAERLFPKTVAVTAAAIDEIIRWHGIDERQAIRDEAKRLPGYCENTLVKRGRNGAEFFELQLLPPTGDAPYEVQFKRYCVPGRCWTYGFQWWSSRQMGTGDRVVYGSEGNDSIGPALKLLAADLDKPRVVELFTDAFGAERIVCRYHRDTLNLLEALAPRSKAYRATKALVDKTLAARRKRIEAERTRASTLCELDTCRGGKALP